LGGRGRGLPKRICSTPAGHMESRALPRDEFLAHDSCLVQKCCRSGPLPLAEIHQTLPLVSLKGWRPYSEYGSTLPISSPSEASWLGLGQGEGEPGEQQEEEGVASMTPKEVVEHLDRNIVGQVGCRAPEFLYASRPLKCGKGHLLGLADKRVGGGGRQGVGIASGLQHLWERLWGR